MTRGHSPRASNIMLMRSHKRPLASEIFTPADDRTCAVCPINVFPSFWSAPTILNEKAKQRQSDCSRNVKRSASFSLEGTIEKMRDKISIVTE